MENFFDRIAWWFLRSVFDFVKFFIVMIIASFSASFLNITGESILIKMTIFYLIWIFIYLPIRCFIGYPKIVYKCKKCNKVYEYSKCPNCNGTHFLDGNCLSCGRFFSSIYCSCGAQILKNKTTA